MDSQIVFYLVLSLYCAMQLWSSKQRTLQRFLWLTATGLVCGCSISVKWTALATPGLIAIVSFFGLHFLEDPLSLFECMWAGAMGIGLYVALFYVHFKTLTHTGPGVAFFPASFRKTLIGEETYDPDAVRQPFRKLFVYLNKYMFTANAGIKTRHHWESYWYQWIVNWRGLLYYNNQTDGKWQTVYLLGNPVVVWGCGAFVGIFIIGFLMSMRYHNVKILKANTRATLRYAMRTCIFLFWGWLINLLPYILVDRSAFVYHYLPGLIYAQLLSGVLVDQLPFRLRMVVTLAAMSAVVGSFVYFAPWVYCFPLTSGQHAERRILPKWD